MHEEFCQRMWSAVIMKGVMMASNKRSIPAGPGDVRLGLWVFVWFHSRTPTFPGLRRRPQRATSDDSGLDTVCSLS